MKNALDRNQPPGWYIVSAALVAFVGMLCVALILFAWPPHMAMSLTGSTVMVFEIAAEDAATPARFSMDALVNALSRRIDPSGTQELIVRPYGQRQVEIIVPTYDPVALESIKRRISTAGVLQFRIVANQRDHDDVIALARAMAEDPSNSPSRVVRDETGAAVGLWAGVARLPPDAAGRQLWKLSPARYVIRDAETGEIIDVPEDLAREPPTDEDGEMIALREFLDSRGTNSIEVLMATNDGYDVTGDDLNVVTRGSDERLNPCVNFSLNTNGIIRFSDLTHDFSPDGNFTRQLGIVLDDKLLAAPNLQGMIVRSARITGHFTNEEVDFLVDILQAGSLPAALEDAPVSESVIAPDPTAKGRMRSVLIGGLAVLLLAWTVMLLRYGWLGSAAGLAGLVQLLLTVAILLSVGVAFSALLVGVLVLISLLATASNAALCELRRREPRERISEDEPERSIFQIAIGLVALLFCCIAAVSVVPYLLGGFATRNLVAALLAGCLSALALHIAVWVVAEALIYWTASRPRPVATEKI